MSAATLAMKLRLDSVRRDEVGYLATFYGKPDTHGNALTVPITEAQAAELTPGGQYVFVLADA